MTTSACEGLNVVELGAGSIAGSLAGMLLADAGARVVKVEPPEGDRLRESLPSGFLVWNRGKESFVADLRTAAGCDAATELLERADVVIEAFGTGVAQAWGLGYEQLAAANPGLIYCSIKGFGSTGAYAHIPAYDGIVAAKTGFWTMGAYGHRPGPVFNSGWMPSMGAAHMALGGILGALLAREQTGRGQRVEATLANGLNAYDYMGTMMWQDLQRRTGNAAGSTIGSAMSGGASRTAFTCPTSDGRWINFTHMLPNQAQALSRALGISQCIDDERYARQPLFATAEHAQEWETMAWEALRAKSYAVWEPILLADPNIPFEMARTCEEALDHPQLKCNGEVIVVQDPDHGPIEQLGPVARFSETPAVVDRSAPRLDQHGGPFEPAPRSGVGATPAHPLAGVTIIELGYFFAMPYGVTMAAALGARVIKLEGAQGDPMRYAFGTPETPAVKTMEGKESLSVDLSKPEGQEIVHRLIKQADAFVDGFRPGVADRLGLGRDTIMSLNPSLLHLHALGYGAEGDYSQRPIYAGVASALAGQVYRHAGKWLESELATSLSTEEAQLIVLPRLRGPIDGDTNAAIAVFSTLLLGLYARARTGRGQWAETSMIGANALAYADDVNRYRDKPPFPLPDEDNLGMSALYRLYRCATGWVFLAAPRQKDFEALVTALDKHDLLADPRFATVADRAINDDALAAEIAAVLQKGAAADWEAELAPKGIAVVAAFEATNSEFTCTDPVMRETGLVIEVDHPTLGRILRHGLPVALSETPGRVAPSCMNGEHTAQILAELGYSAAEIARLHDADVVFGRVQ